MYLLILKNNYEKKEIEKKVTTKGIAIAKVKVIKHPTSDEGLL